MDRFLLPERTDECDFILYNFGTVCDDEGTVALVNPNIEEEFFPEGFHEAHLCDKHGKIVLERLNNS